MFKRARWGSSLKGGVSKVKTRKSQNKKKKKLSRAKAQMGKKRNPQAEVTKTRGGGGGRRDSKKALRGGQTQRKLGTEGQTIAEHGRKIWPEKRKKKRM